LVGAAEAAMLFADRPQDQLWPAQLGRSAMHLRDMASAVMELASLALSVWLGLVTSRMTNRRWFGVFVFIMALLFLSWLNAIFI
jgi:hypothetical protein